MLRYGEMTREQLWGEIEGERTYRAELKRRPDRGRFLDSIRSSERREETCLRLLDGSTKRMSKEETK